MFLDPVTNIGPSEAKSALLASQYFPSGVIPLSAPELPSPRKLVGFVFTDRVQALAGHEGRETRQAGTSCPETLAADVLSCPLWWWPRHKAPCDGTRTIAVKEEE